MTPYIYSEFIQIHTKKDPADNQPITWLKKRTLIWQSNQMHSGAAEYMR